MLATVIIGLIVTICSQYGNGVYGQIQRTGNWCGTGTSGMKNGYNKVWCVIPLVYNHISG